MRLGVDWLESRAAGSGVDVLRGDDKWDLYEDSDGSRHTFSVPANGSLVVRSDARIIRVYPVGTWQGAGQLQTRSFYWAARRTDTGTGWA